MRYGNDLLCIRTVRFNFLWSFLFSHFTSEDLKLKVIRYSRLNWVLWFIDYEQWYMDYDMIRTLGVVLSCVLNFFSPDSVSIVSCTSRCVMVFFTVVTLNSKFTLLTHYLSNVPLYHHIQNFEQQYQRVRRVWYCVLHRACMFLDQCNFSPKKIFYSLIFSNYDLSNKPIKSWLVGLGQPQPIQ